MEVREAVDCPSLVRARFCAFTMGEAEFLWRTLHSRHPERQRPKQEVLRDLRGTCRSYRFTSLRLLEHEAEGERGRVLFIAEISERGRARSFVELSDFEREQGAWRYLNGELRPVRELGIEPSRLSIQVFRHGLSPHSGQSQTLDG